MKNIGDMPVEEFRKNGHELIDWMADYLRDVDEYPVLAQIEPGEIKEKLSDKPPVEGEGMGGIFEDLDKIIMPGMTHWNHPKFMAYFNSSASGPGILAEMVASTFNINGMLWKSCPSATELEEVTLNWLRQMIGLPENYWGIIYDGASSSSLHAIAAARENLPEYKLREKGMTGRKDLKRLRLYASEHAHSSVDKGAITVGVGLEGIRKIAVDENFAMRPEDLEAAIKEDLANGWLPFCVVATVGTTSTTSVDPVQAIADICEKHDIWLHVDAAHAGNTAILPEMRQHFEGCERADSFVLNPHKWMFVPIDLSVFYTRKPDILERAFSLVHEYLKTAEDKDVNNYMNYGIQLGRRFRSLKLWFLIRHFGVEGLQSRIREHLRMGKLFAGWIDESPVFERLAPVPFSTICFRAVVPGMGEMQLNEFNQKLMDEANATGRVFLSHTKLNDIFTIRVVISSVRTTEEHVKEVFELLVEQYNRLTAQL
jgi:aromatic-L-amino-acid decarboxylase